MSHSLDNSGRTNQISGGPWRQEIKATVLNSFTSMQNIKMIDISYSIKNIVFHCQHNDWLQLERYFHSFKVL